MAYDKVVDSAQLDGAMTATAGAIRAKTGGTDPIAWDAATGFAAAVRAIATGGGGIASSVANGKFTTAENMLDATIETGVENMHIFIIFAMSNVLGHGVKAGNLLLFYNIQDPTHSRTILTSTNNGGTSLTSLAENFAHNVDASESIFSIVNNTRITVKNDGDININTSAAAGACFGYFPAGVEYAWYAW